jgi:dTDP-4-amino-4,6-dideoxygalactose transaminase
VASHTPIPLNDLKRHNDAVAREVARAVERVLASGWYILGSQVSAFEAEFAAFCGVNHCVAVGNGTDALELALRSLEIGPGDQVLTAANAGGYSTAAIRATGAEPCYCDIDRDSMLLSASELASGLTPRTRAVIVTHLYGQMADMPQLLEICSRAGLPLLEDCAQAHGACLAGKRAGAWGVLGCFSFYPTKNLGAIGDGGAVITGDARLAERVRMLRQYGWSSRYNSRLAGRNSRLDEIQAAVLRVKLPHLEDWNERRRSIARYYNANLRDLGLALPRISGGDSIAHLYVLRSPGRDGLKTALAAAGIGADIHYPIPDHWQESARGESWAAVRLPVTEECCRQVLTLPCFPEMTDRETERVTLAVRDAVQA